MTCPSCQGELEQKDRRKRGVIDSGGVKHMYSLRRFRCRRCKRLHTELPDFIVPYKRYSGEVIERVVRSEAVIVPYEGRSRQKIKAWYKRVIGHLWVLWRQVMGFASPYLTPSFKSLVRVAVNSGDWPYHPFGRTTYAR